MNRITFIKALDQWAGRFFCLALIAIFRLRGRNEAPGRVVGGVSRILVIRPGGIGDAVLLTPLLTAFKKKFPRAKLYILAERRNAGVFEAHGLAERLFLYDAFFFLESIKILCMNWDMVIDTEQWHYSSAIFAFLTRAKIRCGFDTNNRGFLFTHKVKYEQAVYEAESFLSLYACVAGEAAGFSYEDRFLPLHETYLRQGREMVGRLKGRQTVVILMGASAQQRRWEIQNYDAIVQWILSRKMNVVLCDLPEGFRIPKGSSDGFLLDLGGKASLGLIGGIVGAADLFLSSDTGLMHLACALGTPTVSLFGPGIIEKWAPRGGKHHIVSKGVWCAPCTKFGYTPPCPHNRMCMKNITVDEVKEMIAQALGCLEDGGS